MEGMYTMSPGKIKCQINGNRPLEDFMKVCEDLICNLSAM